MVKLDKVRWSCLKLGKVEEVAWSYKKLDDFWVRGNKKVSWTYIHTWSLIELLEVTWSNIK